MTPPPESAAATLAPAIDIHAWPALSRTPRYPLGAAVARLLFRRAFGLVLVRARFPGGELIGAGDDDSPVFELVRPAAFFARLAKDTKIGLGESYMAGDWKAADGTDLADLLTPFAERLTHLVPAPLQRMRRLVDIRIPSAHENTPQGSRDNIAAHYDLSNELFAAFLDPTLSYSSAWFDETRALAPQTLEAAQLRKIDAILDDARVSDGSRVLEIGSGWGSLAIRAAQRGASVRTITLSREQQELARRRVAEAGLSGKVSVELLDYREVEGEFDAIVSVEMIEAVGEAYWPEYFRAVDRLLAPGGAVAIQAITMQHQRMLATRHSFGWIQKYVFPGGLIPSLKAIDDTLAAHTRLVVSSQREIGLSYAETLRRWREAFDANWNAIHAQGFDEVFRRLWEFYLAYCEAGFRSRYLGVSQLRLTRLPQEAPR